MQRARWLVLIAILALAAAACGGEETPSAGRTTSPGESPPQPAASPLNNEGTMDAVAQSAFSLELDDNYFKPTFIKARPGQTFNIELENEGSSPHTFTVSALNIDVEVQPGTKREIDLTLPAGGTGDVAFVCRFHVSLGMRGAFFFGDAPAAAGSASEGRIYNS